MVIGLWYSRRAQGERGQSVNKQQPRFLGGCIQSKVTASASALSAPNLASSTTSASPVGFSARVTSSEAMPQVMRPQRQPRTTLVQVLKECAKLNNTRKKVQKTRDNGQSHKHGEPPYGSITANGNAESAYSSMGYEARENLKPESPTARGSLNWSPEPETNRAKRTKRVGVDEMPDDRSLHNNRHAAAATVANLAGPEALGNTSEFDDKELVRAQPSSDGVVQMFTDTVAPNQTQEDHSNSLGSDAFGFRDRLEKNHWSAGELICKGNRWKFLYPMKCMKTSEETRKKDQVICASIDDVDNVLKYFNVTIPGAGPVNNIVPLSREEQRSLGTPDIVSSFKVDIARVTDGDLAKIRSDPTISITREALHGTSLSCLADNLRHGLLTASNTTSNKKKRPVDGVYCEGDEKRRACHHFYCTYQHTPAKVASTLLLWGATWVLGVDVNRKTTVNRQWVVHPKTLVRRGLLIHTLNVLRLPESLGDIRVSYGTLIAHRDHDPTKIIDCAAVEMQKNFQEVVNFYSAKKAARSRKRTSSELSTRVKDMDSNTTADPVAIEAIALQGKGPLRGFLAREGPAEGIT